MKLSIDTLVQLARTDDKADQCLVELLYREITTSATYKVVWKRSTDLYHIIAG